MNTSSKRASFYLRDKTCYGQLFRNKLYKQSEKRGLAVGDDFRLKKKNGLLEWKTADPKFSLFSCLDVGGTTVPPLQ